MSTSDDLRSARLARPHGRASGASSADAELGVVAGDSTWDFTNPASKMRILDVMHREYDEFLASVSAPDTWQRPTACAGWDVRDMVGHLVDATESYLDGFDAARHGRDVPSVGIGDMAAATDVAARSFRGFGRDELLHRLVDDTERLFGEFESLSDDDWTRLVVSDRYAGPLPALAIATGVLGGCAVHTWDVREGAGERHSLSADAADLLVPFVFALWGVTADVRRIDQPFAVGIRVSGRNGGETRVDVTEDGIRFERSTLDDCPAVIECDAGTFVLIGYGRVNAGTVHGDRQLASRFRAVFHSI